MSDELNTIENIKSDSILWYNVGVYGDIGYAVPNPSNDIGSLNPNILDITNLIGRNLFMIMHHEDADLSIPPSINTLERIHQLYVRARQIIAGRTTPDGETRFEIEHVSPAGELFRVWPIPYFKVRNAYMRRWAQYALYCLANCFQHTENRQQTTISPRFADVIRKPLQEVYVNMAVELFGKTRTEARADAFTLTEEDLRSYNPGQFFTPTEMIDTVPSFDNVHTEDRKAHLAAGIPLTELPTLQPYPNSLIATTEALRAAKESQINPDTGQLNQPDGRTTNAPSWPNNQSFVGV